MVEPRAQRNGVPLSGVKGHMHTRRHMLGNLADLFSGSPRIGEHWEKQL